MRSKQYFTSIKNNPHEISTDPTSVVGCSNKTDRDSNSEYKKSVNLANA